MNFKEYIQKNKKPIDQEIAINLVQWKANIDKEIPLLKNITQLLLESNSGGKNIRGALVCLGYDLFTKEKKKDIYKVAAAYEILHTSLLIHDDVMDKSLLRRGSPTVFKKLGGDHYGISQAISLGDVGFFLSTKILSETSFPDHLKVSCLSQFSQVILDTIGGQMLDVKLANKISTTTQNNVIKISELKTAQYTIAGPLALGATLAGALKKDLELLTLFGKKLGIAFQIKDDLLGIFGQEKKIGKSVTSDIEEGKNTLLISYALKNALKKQKDTLLKYYGKGKITSMQHAVIKKIFHQTGAYEYSEGMIQQYAKEASALISQFVPDKNNVKVLTSLVDFLITREK